MFLRVFVFLLLTFFDSIVFAESKPLSIMLDWQLNPDHAPLWVAQQEGFFAKHGLDVKLISPGDPSDPAKFAAAGKIDLALTYEPQWIVQQEAGLPLVWVATLVNQPLATVIGSVKITSLQTLKGKTIGYSSSAIDSVFLNAMLKSVHLSSADVTKINIHYDGDQALLAGRVDAVTGAMRNVEPFELKEKNFKYNLFFPEDYGVPSYAELIFVTRVALKNDSRMNAFRQALAESIIYLKQHPEETWKIFAQANPALDDETDHQIWLATVKYFTDTPGVFDQNQYEVFKEFIARRNAP